MERKTIIGENIKVEWGKDTQGMRPGIDGRLPEGVQIIKNPPKPRIKYDRLP